MKKQLHGVALDRFFEMCNTMNAEHTKELISE
jgi:hypothetical protein